MGNSTLKAVILCADDYAIAPGVSQAICELAQRGRLTATGCMTTSNFWPEHAKWLRPFHQHIDVGLHLTLTQGRPSSESPHLHPLGAMPRLMPKGHMPTFGRLLHLSITRQLDPVEITDEFSRQLDAFEKHFKATPVFLDGHHHIQQLPVIRDVVAKLSAERLKKIGGYVRVCWEKLEVIMRRGVDPFKTAMVALPGEPLKRQLKHHQINFNQGFAGVYTPSLTTNYPDLFNRFLQDIREGTVIMCHPGRIDQEIKSADTLTVPREIELAFFKSEEFLKSLSSARVRLGRFHDCSKDSP